MQGRGCPRPPNPEQSTPVRTLAVAPFSLQTRPRKVSSDCLSRVDRQMAFRSYAANGSSVEQRFPFMVQTSSLRTPWVHGTQGSLGKEAGCCPTQRHLASRGRPCPGSSTPSGRREIVSLSQRQLNLEQQGVTLPVTEFMQTTHPPEATSPGPLPGATSPSTHHPLPAWDLSTSFFLLSFFIRC